MKTPESHPSLHQLARLQRRGLPARLSFCRSVLRSHLINGIHLKLTKNTSRVSNSSFFISFIKRLSVKMKSFHCFFSSSFGIFSRLENMFQSPWRMEIVKSGLDYSILNLSSFINSLIFFVDKVSPQKLKCQGFVWHLN